MKNRTKQSKGLAIAGAVMIIGVAFFALPNSASAQAGTPVVQPSTQSQQPIFEGKKGWKFDKTDNLLFFNPSPNPDGSRFIRWKEYTWVVTRDRIVVIDPRPYGTQLQGQRNQMTKDGRQSDEDLMKDLKEQAEDIREAKDPNSGRLPISIGLGLGFDFAPRRGCHRHHHHHHP